MAAYVQVQEQQQLLDVRATGHFVYLQNTCVDRARHLLSLTYCATFGPELRAETFKTCYGLRQAVLQPARAYPLPFMLVGALMGYFLHYLFKYDNQDGNNNDESKSFFDGSVGCLVPDLVNGKQHVGLDCHSNDFVRLLFLGWLVVATLIFFWDTIAVLTIRAIRLSPIRQLCFIQVPPDFIPDSMNEIIEIDIGNQTQLRGIGAIDDSTLIAVEAQRRSIHTLKVNLYDHNFHRRYFAPWSVYWLFGALIPYALAWFFVLTQHELGAAASFKTSDTATWLRRVALFGLLIRGIVEAFRFLRWVIKSIMC
uniref:Uncharacterized protein n=1 Tax=Neobodo designis TaxID=312471 RepID=A0A7S1M2Y4_NEODS